jgi:hypothetical protein
MVTRRPIAKVIQVSLPPLDAELIDAAWPRKKRKWQAYAGLRISFVMVWRKP